MADLKPEKAKEILRDKTVHGKALTPKQKRFMGWVAGGRKQPKGKTAIRKVGPPKRETLAEKKTGKAMGTR